MRFRNAGGTFSAWERIARNKRWRLTDFGGHARLGMRTVEVEIGEKYMGNWVVRERGKDTIYFHHPITPFGRACAGPLGLPKLHVEGLPGIGKALSLRVSNTDATTMTLIVGVSRSSWGGISLPLNLGFVGAFGCDLNVSMDASIYRGKPATIATTMPNEPRLIGITLYYQAILMDPAKSRLETTRGSHGKGRCRAPRRQRVPDPAI